MMEEYQGGRRRFPSLAALSLALWVATFVGLLSDAPSLLSSCSGEIPSRASSLLFDKNARGGGGGDAIKTKEPDDIVVVGVKQQSQERSFPKVAWLMSFPNSGTSYTLRIVRQITNQTTATNYGHEHLMNSNGHIDNDDDDNDDDDNDDVANQKQQHNNNTNSATGTSLLLYSNWTQGPFRANLSQALPEHYILTKTHCGSRCVHCAPDRYLETIRTFQRACLAGRRIDNNISGNASKTTTIPTMYKPTVVARAVHLIRHPLDNIVARFHLSRRRNRDNQNVDYPNNATGFQAWCHSLDRRYWQYETHTPWLDDTLLQLWKHVPCHAEFFKYIQWHNLAHFTTTAMMDIPVHVLRYEDYAAGNGWKRTVSTLLNFLELPAVAWNDATPFDMHSYHRAYYTQEQVSNISRLLQHVAAAPVWKTLVGPYFVSDLEG